MDNDTNGEIKDQAEYVPKSNIERFRTLRVTLFFCMGLYFADFSFSHLNTKLQVFQFHLLLMKHKQEHS